MELNTLAILMIAGSMAVLFILMIWVYALVALSALRRNTRGLKERADTNDATLGVLVEAWNRSVALCDNCQRVFWISEVGLTKTMGSKVLHYCQNCKDKA